MSVNKFTLRLTVKSIVIVCLIAILIFLGAYETTIMNNVAMGQMTNSDEAYILMTNFQNTKLVVERVINIAMYFIIATCAYDTYKFFKVHKNDEY